MHFKLPAIIPISHRIYVEGTCFYNARCLSKDDIRAFSTLSSQAKHLIREYYFGTLLGDAQQVNRVCDSFRSSVTGFASYLELLNVEVNEFVISAVLKGEFEPIFVMKSDDSLFIRSEKLTNMKEHNNDVIIEEIKDVSMLLDTGKRLYEPLKPDVCYNDYRDYDEYSASYREAAKHLCEQIRSIRCAGKPSGVWQILSYSLALPFVQCCRLAVELKIKAALHRLNKFNARRHKTHDLKSLWDAFVCNVPCKLNAGKDKHLLKLMQYFVSFLMDIDDTGNLTRYPDSTENRWLNVKAVYDNLSMFLRNMDNINYDLFEEDA